VLQSEEYAALFEIEEGPPQKEEGFLLRALVFLKNEKRALSVSPL
jgi:hypothetical protein